MHPVTHAAFRGVPWHLFGTLAAGRSQLVFRTPYLDNEIVRLAYRAPPRLHLSVLPALRLIHWQDPGASVNTDRSGSGVGQAGAPRQSPTACSAGRPSSSTIFTRKACPTGSEPFDPLLDALARTNLLGLHKFLPYRSWFRRELSDYARAVLTDPQTARQPYWNARVLPALIDDHVRGRHNRVRELNAVLTVEAVERLLVRDSVRVAEETKRVVRPEAI